MRKGRQAVTLMLLDTAARRGGPAQRSVCTGGTQQTAVHRTCGLALSPGESVGLWEGDSVGGCMRVWEGEGVGGGRLWKGESVGG